MDELLKQMVTGLPNFAVAVWVILQYQNTIRTLLDNQQKLIDQLMARHSPQDLVKTELDRVNADGSR